MAADAASRDQPRVRHYIDGRLARRRSAAREYANHNPWTGEVLDDGRRRRRRGRPARHRRPPHARPRTWADARPASGSEIFLRAADALDRRRRRDRRPARRRDRLRRTLRRRADQVQRVPAAPGGRRSPTPRPGSCCRRTAPAPSAFAVRRPVGVVGAIATWNASLVLAGRAIVGPLAVGNTVVLKPSEESPLTGGHAVGRAVRRGRAAAGRAQRGHPRAGRRRRDRPRS